MNHLIRLLLAAGCLTAAILGPLRAREASAPPRVAANNTEQLRNVVGKTVTVYGKVSHTSTSSSGHQFLDFYAADFSVVCFKSDASKFKDGGPAKLYADQEIEITGQLELYRGKPQIKLRATEQISVASAGKTDLEASDPSSTTESKAASGKPIGFPLKQLDATTWLSPAGLRYAGRDPEGLTRVDHVLRHTRDQPTRAGSHGVFDGGKDRALAVIDQAWKRVKSKTIRPQTESGRSSYLVPMGRRVGFLGGQAGKSRGNPPLTKVFIVVKSGTSDLVTAFPR